MKLPYAESSVFLVPLRGGGYGRGVVARASSGGKALFGYFFGPRLASAETASVENLEPASAILRVMFGDLGLINRTWPIYGTVPAWDRTQWPMPDFVRRDPLGRRNPVLVRYSDVDPLHVEAEVLVNDDTGLIKDSLYGYGAVEIQLTKLLS